MKAGEAGPETAAARAGLPLGRSQCAPWALEQLAPGSSLYSMGFRLRCQGRLDAARLRAALGLLVARHDALRTSLRLAADGPVQVVERRVGLHCPLIDLGALPPQRRPPIARELLLALRGRAFDLGVAPLLRCQLVRLGPCEHDLDLVTSHLVVDGRSIGLLTDDLIACYRHDAPAPPPPRSFHDALRRQLQAAAEEPAAASSTTAAAAAAATRAPVQERRRGHAPAGVPLAGWGVEVPADRPRPPRALLRAAHVSCRVDGSLAAALDRLARQRRTSAFQLALASWAALHARLSGEEEIVLGVPLAGRTDEAERNVVGMFVNTLPLVLHCAAGQRFGELLRQAGAALRQLVRSQRSAAARPSAGGPGAVQESAGSSGAVRPSAGGPGAVQENAGGPGAARTGVGSAGAAPARWSGFPAVFCQLLDYDRTVDAGPGLTVTSETVVEREVTPFDLVIYCGAVAEGSGAAGADAAPASGAASAAGPDPALRLIFEYGAELFDRTSVLRLAAHLRALLAGIAAEPDAALAELPWLSTAERHQVVVEWNDRAAAFPRHASLARLFAEQAGRRPEALAVADAAGHLTYGELARRAGRLARRLRDMGVGAERAVGLCCATTSEWVTAMLGVLAAGGCYVPLAAAGPRQRLARMLGECGVTVVVAPAAVAAGLGLRFLDGAPDGVLPEAPRVRWFDLDLAAVETGGPRDGSAASAASGAEHTDAADRSAGEEGARAAEGAKPADGAKAAKSAKAADGAESADGPDGADATGLELAYVMTTSGTTGRPKAIAVPQRAVSRLAFAGDGLRLAPGDRVAQVSDPGFDAFTFEIWAALLNGAAVVEVRREVLLAPWRLRAELRGQAIDAMFLTAALFHQLAHEAPDAFPALRDLLVGGEAVDPAAVRRVQAAGGPRRLVNAYGPTEGTTFSTWQRLAADGPPARRAPIGRPLANTAVVVCSRDLRPLPPGAVGEICIGGEGLARGYQGQPALTAERFVPSPFGGRPGSRLYRTGDLARLLAGGEVDILGRRDDQLKVRGFRIELGEIEAALRLHPAVAEALAAVHDQGGERRLVAAVVPHPGAAPGGPEAAVPAETVSAETLRSHLGRSLPGYMLPAGFLVLAALPRNAHGKADRRQLAELAGEPGAALAAGGGEGTRPRNAIERELAALWEAVLGTEVRSVHDDFFALGGHSLLASRVLLRLRDLFAVELPLGAVFAEPTVAGLGRRVQAALAAGGGAAAPRRLPRAADGGGQFPLSFGQRRLWLLDRLFPGLALYNIPEVVRLSGPLDVAALGRALAAVVRRHESLRTRFAEAGAGGGAEDGVAQIVLPALPAVPHPLPLPLVDLGALPAAARRRAADALGEAEAVRAFDLGAGRPIRWLLLRLGAAEHRLLLTLHHIAADGWSVGVLHREAGALYDALCAAPPGGAAAAAALCAGALPALPLQYADFAVWQRHALPAAAVEAHLAHWRACLAGGVPPLSLPADRPLPERRSFAGAERAVRLPGGPAAALLALGRRLRATRAMTYLAAFHALLARLGGQERVVVGMPVAGRGVDEVLGLIGFFANHLLMVGEPRAGLTFGELLERTRAAALAAYAHQDLPFELLVKELNPDRDPSRNPLAQIVFAWQDAPAPPPRLTGLTVTTEAPPVRVTRFDLELHLGERGGRIEGRCIYARELFDGATAGRLVAAYERLLAAAAAAPETPIGDLDLLGETARQQLMVEWNDTASSYPRNAGLARLFARQARLRPGAPAVESGGRVWTYGELDAWSAALARSLRRAGLAAEGAVGLCAESCDGWVAGMLASVRAGGFYVPLDLTHPARRLAQMIEETGITVVIAPHGPAHRLRVALASAGAIAPAPIDLDAARPAPAAPGDAEDAEAAGGGRESRPEGGEGGPSAEDERADGASRPPVDDEGTDVAGERLAVVLYTSGSTGQPKGVGIPQGAVARLVLGVDHLRIEAGDRVAQTANMGFDAVTFEVWGALAGGATLVELPREALLAPRRLAEELGRRRIDVLFLTTALFHLVARDAPAGLAGVREVVVGGEPLDPAAAERVLAAGPPRRLSNAYGPTESTTFTTWHRVTGMTVAAPDGGGRRVPVGRPIANTEVLLLDRSLRPVPPGMVGELCIGGGGLARGYLGRPELTAERFVPWPSGGGEPGRRLYRTGDLARQLACGTLDLLGRADGQVKIRGFRVELGEIEAALCEHPAVAAAVAALDRADGEARLVAGVVVRDAAGLATPSTPSTPPEGARCDGARSGEAGGRPTPPAVPSVPTVPTAAELRAHLERLLPPHQLPAEIVHLPALPLTSHGKVDRAALLAVCSRGTAPRFPAVAGPAPATPLERQLASIWEELLGRGGIAADDDFFALGGHSLLAAAVTTRVRERLGVELPLREVFDAPTVAALARCVAVRMAAGAALSATPADAASAAVPTEVASAACFPLSFAQQRLWFMARLNPVSDFYNMAYALHFRGLLDRGSLEEALGEVERRHAVLRTRIELVEGEPVQVAAAPRRFLLPQADLTALPAAAAGAAAERAMATAAAAPFALAAGPLWRTILFRLPGEPADGGHLLLVCLHHIVADGWSVGVLHRELARLYDACRAGRPSPLAALPLQYGEYAAWQRRRLQDADGAALAGELAHWRARLAEVPPVLELPPDRPRPAVQSFAGAVRQARLAPPLAAALRRLGQARGATLAMTLLGGFLALLARLTGEERLAVGSPVAGRGRGEHEGLIGLFVNTLVMAGDLRGDPPFAALLGRVRETALAAYEHQELPFETLVAELAPRRDLSRNPLCQVMFAAQTAPMAPPRLAGLETTLLPLPVRTTRFDVELHLFDQPAGAGAEPVVEGFCAYSTDLFDAPTMARLLRSYDALLASAAADPGLPLSRLELLSAAERHQLLREWNDTAPASLPTRMPETAEETVLPLLRRAAAAHPATLALDDGTVRLSYRELGTAVAALARRLRRAGAGPEVVVAVHLGRSVEQVVALLAVLAAGAVYLPLDPELPARRKAWMLRDAGAAVVVTTPALAAASTAWAAESAAGTDAAAAGGGADPARTADATHFAKITGIAETAEIAETDDTEEIAAPAAPSDTGAAAFGAGPFAAGAGLRGATAAHGPEPGGPVVLAVEPLGRAGTGAAGSPDVSSPDPLAVLTPARVGGENLAYVLYTSGSTGTPKAVAVAHRGLLNLVLWHRTAYALGPADRASQLGALGFDLSVFETVPALAAGATLHLVPEEVRRDPARLGAWLGEAGISVAFLPTALLHAMVAGGFGGAPRLRLLLTGGEALQPLARNLGCPLINHYGPTESTIATTAGTVAVGAANPAGAVPPPIGRPLTGLRVHVVDRWGGLAAAGAPGELCLTGAGIARGYHRRPELTAERFVPDPFVGAGAPGSRLYRTGDRARTLADGRLEYLGRLDRQLKVRGFRIEPAEIEAALLDHPGVREVCVLAVPAPGAEARLAAFVVPRSAAAPPAPLTAAELRRHLAARLPAHHVPAAFVILDALPATPHGKVDRAALAALDAGAGAGRTVDAAFVAPRTACEQRIAAVWRQVLPGAPVGIDDPFFELGADSLAMARAAALLETELGRAVPLVMLFRFPTVRTLAEGLAGAAEEPTARPPDPAPASGVPPGSAPGAAAPAPVTQVGTAPLATPSSGAAPPAVTPPAAAPFAAFLPAAVLPPAAAGPATTLPTVAAPPAAGPDAPEPVSFPAGGRRHRVRAEAAPDAVAVIGMAGRFPGAAGVAELWRNQLAAVDAVSRWSAAELAAAGVPEELSARPDYVPARGALAGVELFDAEFFGLQPREAEVMDPQLRVFLECAWEACESAGHDVRSARLRGGIYAGAAASTYLHTHLLARSDIAATLSPLQVRLGNSADFLASWVAYKLNLQGPCVAVQTACSTSLTAVYFACRGLLAGDCDLALAGGVSIQLPLTGGYLAQEGGVMSPDGRCRAFDAGAQGAVPGSGAGLVVLRRLRDALEDGDPIQAVIRGVGISNDGAVRAGFTAPGVDGQLLAVSQALDMAGVDPETVRYVEAHGSGTAVGDPIEVEALTRAFRRGTAARGFCALASIKSTVGHLDSAAGIAGLIRAVCAVRDGKLPPSLHFVTPNPRLDLAASPFYVNSRPRDWPPLPGVPRRAGVSSLGIGGTNVHAVLEEPPPASAGSATRPWQQLVLSARSAAALAAQRRALADHLEAAASPPAADLKTAGSLAAGHLEAPGGSAPADHHLEAAGSPPAAHLEAAGSPPAVRLEAAGPPAARAALADVAYTLKAGRHAFRHRLSLVCRDRAEAVAALRGAPGRQLQVGDAGAGARRLGAAAYLLPGVGDVEPGVLGELARHEPAVRAAVARCSEILAPRLGLDLEALLCGPAAGAGVHAREAQDQGAVAVPGNGSAAHAGGGAVPVGEAAAARPARWLEQEGAEGEGRLDLRRLLGRPAPAHGATAHPGNGHGGGAHGANGHGSSHGGDGRGGGDHGGNGQGGRSGGGARWDREEPGPLSETWLSQPATFVCEYALAQLLAEWGLAPAAMLGYSVGELVAACLAGVLPLADALELVAVRAAAIEELPAGRMLAVPLPAAEMEPWLAGVTGAELALAATPGPQLSVVGGPPAAVAALAARLADAGVVCREVRTTHAFHTAAMEPARAAVVRAAARCTLSAPRVPFLSNVTGTWIRDEEATDPAYWGRQLVAPVRFAEGLERLLARRDLALVEVGAGQTLATLARQHEGYDGHTVVSLLPDRRLGGSASATLLSALGRLWVDGLAPDWSGFYRHERRRRLALPTYPFERRRYWIEPAPPTAAASAGMGAVAATAAGAGGVTATAAGETMAARVAGNGGVTANGGTASHGAAGTDRAAGADDAARSAGGGAFGALPPAGPAGAPGPAAGLGKPADLADWFYVQGWRRAETPARAAATANGAPPVPPDASGPWLLFLDPWGLGEAMANRLEQGGQEVVRVVAGDRFQAPAALGEPFRIVPDRREDYGNLLRHLQRHGRRGGLPGRIVHLWSIAAGDVPPAAPAAIASPAAAPAIERGLSEPAAHLFSLLHLAQALGERPPGAPVTLSVVTNQVQEVTGLEALCPHGALLLGACRVIAQETPEVACRAIDIELPAPATPEWIAGLAAELIDEVAPAATPGAPPPTVVAHRGRYRWLPTLEPRRIGPPERPRLRRGGVYLISGCSAASALCLAEHLAAALAARLVLLVPKALPPALAGRVERLAERAADLLVLPADPADPDAPAAAVRRALDRHGELHGVIHHAAAPTPGLIAFAGREGLEAVLAPAVEATRGLVAAVAAVPAPGIDFLALLSSTAGLLGGIGQVAAAAGSAFVDALAAQLHAAGTPPVASLAWDPFHWEVPEPETAAGLAPEVRRLLAETRETFGITGGEMAELFERALGSGLPRVLVAGRRLPAVLAGLETPHGGSLAALGGTAPAAARHPRPDLETPFQAPATTTEAELCALWEDAFGFPVGVNDSFFELDGSSLLAIQILTRIRTRLAVDLPIGAFFEAPTVAELAAGIDRRQNAASSDGKAPAGGPGSGQGVSEDLARLLAEVEAISDAEAERLLRVEQGAGG